MQVMAIVARNPILIVEDSLDLQTLLEQLLTSEGYVVERALNGQEALDILNVASVLPAMILLDLMMPVMDGSELKRKLSADARFSSIPIVFMTADSHPETKFSHSPASEFLKKPIEVDQLLKLAARFAGRDAGDAAETSAVAEDGAKIP